MELLDWINVTSVFPITNYCRFSGYTSPGHQSYLFAVSRNVLHLGNVLSLEYDFIFIFKCIKTVGQNYSSNKTWKCDWKSWAAVARSRAKLIKAIFMLSFYLKNPPLSSDNIAFNSFNINFFHESCSNSKMCSVRRFISRSDHFLFLKKLLNVNEFGLYCFDWFPEVIRLDISFYPEVGLCLNGCSRCRLAVVSALLSHWPSIQELAAKEWGSREGQLNHRKIDEVYCGTVTAQSGGKKMEKSLRWSTTPQCLAVSL